MRPSRPRSFSILQRAQSCRAAAVAVAMMMPRVVENDAVHVVKKAT
jgi:hypothetical protein